MKRTGWPPGMLQDDSRDLSRWLAGQPDAMQRAREAAAEIRQNSRMTTKPEAPKRPRGRPPVAEADRMIVGSMRLTADEWAKLKRLGMARLRAWLAKAKEQTNG